MLPKTFGRYRRLRSEIHASSVMQASAVEAEGDQREAQDEHRDQHIIGLGGQMSPSDELALMMRDFSEVSTSAASAGVFARPNFGQRPAASPRVAPYLPAIICAAPLVTGRDAQRDTPFGTHTERVTRASPHRLRRS